MLFEWYLYLRIRTTFIHVQPLIKKIKIFKYNYFLSKFVGLFCVYFNKKQFVLKLSKIAIFLVFSWDCWTRSII